MTADPSSAEQLHALIIAAREALGEYRYEVEEANGMPGPDWQAWAVRLSTALGNLVAELAEAEAVHRTGPGLGRVPPRQDQARAGRTSGLQERLQALRDMTPGQWRAEMEHQAALSEARGRHLEAIMYRDMAHDLDEP